MRSGAITRYRRPSCRATASQWRDELIIPWIRTTGGPSPISRYSARCPCRSTPAASKPCAPLTGARLTTQWAAQQRGDDPADDEVDRQRDAVVHRDVELVVLEPEEVVERADEELRRVVDGADDVVAPVGLEDHEEDRGEDDHADDRDDEIDELRQQLERAPRAERAPPARRVALGVLDAS